MALGFRPRHIGGSASIPRSRVEQPSIDRDVASFLVACAVLGGAVLVLQLVLSALGLHHDGSDAHVHTGHELTHASSEGLNLFSVRTIAAFVAFFGIAGRAILAGGLGAVPALVGGAAVGFGAMVAVAKIMRAMLRFDSDATVRIESAIGAPATVYLRVPGRRAGAGKVHITLQSRTVELNAVTADDELPTGSRVIVVDVVAPDTVEVALSSHVGDFLDASV